MFTGQFIFSICIPTHFSIIRELLILVGSSKTVKKSTILSSKSVKILKLYVILYSRLCKSGKISYCYVEFSRMNWKRWLDRLKASLH
jgi:hypothetical protein